MNTQHIEINNQINSQSIVIKPQNGGRIPYDNILSTVQRKLESEENEFAIIAIMKTDNEDSNEEILFQGTEEECEKWFGWFDRELSLPLGKDPVILLEYPIMTVMVAPDRFLDGIGGWRARDKTTWIRVTEDQAKARYKYISQRRKQIRDSIEEKEKKEKGFFSWLFG